MRTIAAALACAGLWLTGCASRPGLPELPVVPQTQVSVETLLDGGIAPSNLVESRVSVKDPGGWLRYEAQYRLDGGELLPRLTGAEYAPLTAAPSRLAGDTFTQTVQTQLPRLIGTAPTLSFDAVSGTQWGDAGELRREEQRARLVWNPAPIDVQLQWSAPRTVPDPGAPLDCGVGASLRLGLAALGADKHSISLGGRGCRIDAPARSAEALEVQTVSGSWQFGKPRLQHGLALTRVETLADDADRGSDTLGAGYELKFSQARRSRRWTGDTALALRHVDDPQGQAGSGWTATANIERRLRQIGLTAGWQRDADPLWFVPGLARPVDQVALGLDLRRWLASSWGMDRLINASVSYRWNESSDPALDGGGIYWNLSKSW